MRKNIKFLVLRHDETLALWDLVGCLGDLSTTSRGRNPTISVTSGGKTLSVEREMEDESSHEQGCLVNAKRVDNNLPLLCKPRSNRRLWRTLGWRHWQQNGQHWGLGEFSLVFAIDKPWIGAVFKDVWWLMVDHPGVRLDSRSDVWSSLWPAAHHARPDRARPRLWVPGNHHPIC